jgi:AcrR family transcriptional regulator
MTPRPSDLADPLASLPPTAKLLVEVARRLLVDSGYASLSLERVTSECGLNKTAVRYYFQSKSGLLETVIESLMFDHMKDLLAELESSTGPTRLHRFVQAKKRLSANRELFQAWVELLPAISRDPELAQRAAGFYEWLVQVNVHFLGLGDENDEVSRCLAKLLIGVGDGLGIQNLMDSEAFRSEDAYAVLERLLASSDLQPFLEEQISRDGHGEHPNEGSAADS